jgi:hypothetical protein
VLKNGLVQVSHHSDYKITREFGGDKAVGPRMWDPSHNMTSACHEMVAGGSVCRACTTGYFAPAAGEQSWDMRVCKMECGSSRG